MGGIKAIIFDAYGTLYDVQGTMGQKFNDVFPGKGESIREIWRAKYHEYNLFRSVTNQYKDFWKVTNDALTYALKHLKIEASDSTGQEILEQYFQVKPFDHVAEGLSALNSYNKMILSNGTLEMLNKMIINSGLQEHFLYIVSSDEVSNYKPSMTVYELARSKLSLNKDEILFVSSNAWDAAAAKIYGFKVCWLNRRNAVFEELDGKPDHEVKDLSELAGILHLLSNH
ncbi:haloacid dehalogenase type II [Cohnella sp. AR92]|uniref:haloacid dehalogenase type II n=1 Tax=Cohnella sp. AR92 TaxID=648716 RepID=UPI0013156C5B|nr:haloacid dehalogenase type II [Cohnella sp. AR92]